MRCRYTAAGWWRLSLATAGAAAAMSLAACGSGSGGAATGAASKSSSGDASNAFVAKAKAQFDAATKEQTGKPPADGPKAVSGKRIVVIPCAMAAEGCARPARAAIEAAKAIGWKTTLIDPAGDPSKTAQAVQKAIAIKADGIILESIDADSIAGPLGQAKAAGIKVVAGSTTNTAHGYDALIPPQQSLQRDGYLSGVAAFHLADDDLKMIAMEEDSFGVDRVRVAGLDQFFQDCKAAGASCDLLGKTNFQLTEAATQGPSQAAALARQNPGFNVLWGVYDAALSYFIQGVQQAGLSNAGGFAVGFDANSANLEMIRNGGYEKATIGLPMVWVGYAQIDAMNRLFAGQKPVDEGVHSKLLTKDNVPSSGAWDGDTDVRPAYRKIWGV